MPNGFSHELKQFVEHNIESVPQLEALLLLRKEPDRAWSAVDIAKALYIQEDAAAALLAEFVRREFAKYPTSDAGNIIYRARDQTTDRLIDELQAAYQDRRVAVISLIYSKPLNKVQTFADAFRFGKENPK
jgi:hypothetical protein